MKRTKVSTFFYELTGRLSNLQTTQFFVLTFLLALCTINVNAQDVIIKKDGSEIEAKVQEVNASTIKYKRFEMQDGPAYEIAKSEVFMIKYPSGQKDIFNHTNTIQNNRIKVNKPAKNNIANKKNAIGVNPIMLFFDLDSKLAYAEYERLIGDRISIGGRILHTEKYGYRYDESTTGGGVFIRKYFNNGAGLKGFYIGSNLDIVGVEWNESWTEAVWNGDYYEYRTKYEYGSGRAIAVTSQFGYKLNIGKSIYIEPSFSAGFYSSSTTSNEDSYDEIGAIIAPALTFGFKF